MRATPLTNVHHAVGGVLLTVRRRLGDRQVGARSLGAGVM